MGVTTKETYQFTTESSWSNGNVNPLCLKTGEWRTRRPVIKMDLCNGCGICAVFCPPQCILDDGDYYKVDLEYCKGCGICAKECPKKAITMTPEGEYADDCSIR